ncbi:hypothetical protein GCM10010390_86340 [Streptomyces mordarskii]|uniref:Uncharacterized protein n=1 Tax=Streptomyces mordarskii TaxID=1226758 RepID=A0ABP3PP79_9ACTN
MQVTAFRHRPGPEFLFDSRDVGAIRRAHITGVAPDLPLGSASAAPIATLPGDRTAAGAALRTTTVAAAPVRP